MPEVQSRTYANPRLPPRRNHYRQGPGFLYLATQGGRLARTMNQPDSPLPAHSTVRRIRARLSGPVNESVSSAWAIRAIC